ncbi:MAG: tRNA (adenosine(37)-N6)-threonylcarbamoyltransferase complex dimerization subunit type 1 TsaB [Candidatus Eremiobacterota bacterium]
MKILGFDTATNWCSIGLTDGESLIGEWTVRCKMTQLTRLIPGIKMLLEAKDVRLSDLACIAVTKGPGSFTGVRLGLVTARTLSQVTSIDLTGVNSLEVLVYQLGMKDGITVPLLDARKGEVYAGFYRWKDNKIINIKESNLYKPSDLASEINILNEPCNFTGHEIIHYRDDITKTLKVPFRWAPDIHGIIRGSSVALLGREQLMDGRKDSCLNLEPVYIRPPDAKVKKEKL